MTLERLVDHTSHIAIDDDVHGPAGDRTYRFLPTYFLRCLAQLGVTVAAA